MGATEIRHGPVVGLKAGRFRFGLNTQSICYRIGSTLVDTGPPNQWRAVRSFVTQQEDRYGIDQIVVTHHHEDHAGNAGRIQELLDAPVYAPAASLERLKNGFRLELYRRLVWGSPVPVEAEAVPEVLSLGSIGTLHPIPAPGHAEDMTCYLVPERGFLFTADLFIVRRPQYVRFDEHIPRLVRSIHHVLEYDFETVFCAHRGVIENGRAALKEKARYLEALCGVARRRYRQDKRSVQEITREMLGREGFLRYFSGGDFSKRNLIASCLEPAEEKSEAQIVESNETTEERPVDDEPLENEPLENEAAAEPNASPTEVRTPRAEPTRASRAGKAER